MNCDIFPEIPTDLPSCEDTHIHSKKSCGCGGGCNTCGGCGCSTCRCDCQNKVANKATSPNITLGLPTKAEDCINETQTCAKQEPEFDTITSGFVWPSKDNTVTIGVCNSDVYAIGMCFYFLPIYGWMKVSSKPTSKTVELTNTGYNENSSAGTTIPDGTRFTFGNCPKADVTDEGIIHDKDNVPEVSCGKLPMWMWPSDSSKATLGRQTDPVSVSEGALAVLSEECNRLDVLNPSCASTGDIALFDNRGFCDDPDKAPNVRKLCLDDIIDEDNPKSSDLFYLGGEKVTETCGDQTIERVKWYGVKRTNEIQTWSGSILGGTDSLVVPLQTKWKSMISFAFYVGFPSYRESIIFNSDSHYGLQLMDANGSVFSPAPVYGEGDTQISESMAGSGAGYQVFDDVPAGSYTARVILISPNGPLVDEVQALDHLIANGYDSGVAIEYLKRFYNTFSIDGSIPPGDFGYLDDYTGTDITDRGIDLVWIKAIAHRKI